MQNEGILVSSEEYESRVFMWTSLGVVNDLLSRSVSLVGPRTRLTPGYSCHSLWHRPSDRDILVQITSLGTAVGRMMWCCNIFELLGSHRGAPQARAQPAEPKTQTPAPRGSIPPAYPLTLLQHWLKAPSPPSSSSCGRRPCGGRSAGDPRRTS